MNASLSYNIKHSKWPQVRKICFGWTSNFILFFGLLFTFALYACELFEPRDDPDSPPMGNSGALLLAWSVAAIQRFILNEPLLIFAATGLPVILGSTFCANCCGEGGIKALEVFLEGFMSSLG